MELLCIGDLHLGRRPGHSSVAAHELADTSAIAPRTAWQRCVSFAVERGVDAVVLTGDLAENARDFYEAYTDLYRGIERLREHGIPAIAVAGNHDHEILPDLARSIDGLKLLGAGSQWENTWVSGADTAVELVGWSFSAERAASPLDHPDQLPPALGGEAPRLGVLHCDRDGTSTAYAPVTSATLAAAPLDGWLLGHIHKPDDLAEQGPNGYLGSVSGLDPTEDGPRGPWLLRVSPDGDLAMEHILLAPLRWETLPVDITELTDPGEVRELVLQRLRALDEHLQATTHTPPVAVGVRARFVGRTRFRRELRRQLDEAGLTEQAIPIGERLYFVDAWHLAARPAIDLEQRAQGNDPVGALAQRLLLLEQPDSEACRELVARAKASLQDFAGNQRFARLEREPPDDDETIQYLREAGLQALEALIDQEEQRP